MKHIEKRDIRCLYENIKNSIYIKANREGYIFVKNVKKTDKRTKIKKDEQQ